MIHGLHRAGRLLAGMPREPLPLPCPAVFPAGLTDCRRAGSSWLKSRFINSPSSKAPRPRFTGELTAQLLQGVDAAAPLGVRHFLLLAQRAINSLHRSF